MLEYIHGRYLRFYMEQDVVGHMEADLPLTRSHPDRVSMAFCFVDLTGFTRFTEEEGDEEALDLVERFVETVEATLPADATIVKTIGDEVMIVSSEPRMLTEWAVGFLTLFDERPRPRVAIHCGGAVYRDGDYFGSDVNLTHRVVTRALAGEVLVTRPVVDAIGETEYLDLEPIGEVALKGLPEPTELFVATARTCDVDDAVRDAGDSRRGRVRISGRVQSSPAIEALADAVEAGGLIDRRSAASCSSPAAPTRPAPRRRVVALCGPESIAAVHLNYGLRADSGEDERAARALCAKLRIDLHVERPDLGRGNVQARARDARYAAAEALRRKLGYDWVATGHTRSDVAETFLYRLAVSPGTRPLLGLAPRSGDVVRPLHSISREETRAVATEAELPFVDDPSNASPRYARNRIRNEILPRLAEIGPEVERNIAATHAELHEEAELLADVVAEALDRGRRRRRRDGDRGRASSSGCRPGLRRLALRELAERAAGRRVALNRGHAVADPRRSPRRARRAARSRSAAASAPSARPAPSASPPAPTRCPRRSG